MINKRGITLIALIITIIVMLILVAVTINMAVNGGLFGYAGNATRDTELEKNKELLISEGIIGGKRIDEWVDGGIVFKQNSTIPDEGIYIRINLSNFTNVTAYYSNLSDEEIDLFNNVVLPYCVSMRNKYK